MRKFVIALAALIGTAFIMTAVTSPAEAALFPNFKAKREAHKEAHVQKKVVHLYTKTVRKAAKIQTKATSHPKAYARKSAHLKKRTAHKVTHLQKKVQKLKPTASATLHQTTRVADEAMNVPLVRTAMRYNGTNPTGWSHNWCGHFLSMALAEAGFKAGPNLASAYASYGRPTEPRPGAIAVMPHHVGIVASVAGGYVMLVSGNHGGKSGHRTVGLGRYPIGRVIAFRMPT